ncbi:hypothetical protein H6F67_19575 [Microcoleus sp. FACHB-1515]|uniref:calcium-binding protein n=1 Tax=Cyanophyceae TaxID=3028117 RepID=UPI0016851F94|nr:hypothetical protein [Microcoleus sp. FACHB-1515]MBD2092052.1 hypothetical protein [Microcoleus sp. FACHB-1515]
MELLVENAIGSLNLELHSSAISFIEISVAKLELNQFIGIGIEPELESDSPSEIDRDLQPSLFKSAGLNYSRSGRKITGTSRANQIVGTQANDIILGQGGNDELYGENGIDRILGGTGNDYLEGGKGGDTLYGGAGDDVLMCGRIVGQADQYDGLTRIEDDAFYNFVYGGSGRDTFALGLRGKGNTFIRDFRNGADQFALSEGMSLGNISVDYNSITNETRIYHGDKVVGFVLGNVVDQIDSSDFSYI